MESWDHLSADIDVVTPARLTGATGEGCGRAFGELIEDRVWVAQEIRRLRSELESMKVRWTARRTRQADLAPSREAADGFLNSNRLLRLKELRQDDGIGAFDPLQDGRRRAIPETSEAKRTSDSLADWGRIELASGVGTIACRQKSPGDRGCYPVVLRLIKDDCGLCLPRASGRSDNLSTMKSLIVTH